jgi:hypothetical protein
LGFFLFGHCCPPLGNLFLNVRDPPAPLRGILTDSTSAPFILFLRSHVCTYSMRGAQNRRTVGLPDK